MTALSAQPIPAKPRDDAPRLQQQINSLAKTGGVLNLQQNDFYLGSPLILPRTGPLPTTAVQINGAGQFATNLRLLPSFPPNRAAIEWAPGAGNLYGCWGQKISNLTIWLANGVPGKAIWYQPASDGLASYANVSREWLQLDLENVRIECNNTDHEVLIDLGTGSRFCQWKNVTADPWPGPSPKFDTLLIRTATSYAGYNNLAPDDGVGFVCSHLSGIYPMLMRGGACRTFEGRLFQSTLEDSQDCGGRFGTGAIAYHLLNSANSTVRNISCEPKGSQFLRIENSYNITADHIAGGCPGRKDGQTSIAVMGSQHVRLSNHTAILGEASFSQFGLSLMTVDGLCTDVAASDFDVTVLGGSSPAALASQQITIDPAATGCTASGWALQAWSPNVDAAGNVITYRQPYSIEN